MAGFMIVRKGKEKRKSIIFFECFISIGMPFIIRLIVNKSASTAVLPTFINAFSFWFVIGASLLPVGIAS
jgi:hypothetical protein